MFCKYCGSSIPAGSTVCPNCGKDLTSRPAPVAGGVKSAAPFFLLIAVFYVPTLLSLVSRLLLIFTPAGPGSVWPLLVSLPDPVLGGLILFFGVKRGKIDITSYRYSDALVLACLWLLAPWLSSAAESAFSIRYSEAFYIAVVSVFPTVRMLFRLAHVWTALGILLLGLGRKGAWKPEKGHLFAAAGGMLLLSLLGLTFAQLSSAISGASPEYIVYTVVICRIWSLFSWLWPAAVLLTFRRLGSGRIGPVAAALGFLGMFVAELILLPVLIFTLDLGPYGFGIAIGLAPLVPLLVTHLLSGGTQRPVWGKKAGD